MMRINSRFRNIGAAAALAVVLAACVTPTPYQQAVKAGGEGYNATKIETGKYRVTFKGNTQTDLATVENYILLRAAELTLADGFGHFEILDDSETSLSTFRSTSSGFGGGFGTFGRRGFFNNGFGGVSTASTRTRETQAFDIGAVVQAYPGQKADDNVSAFNAQEVIDNLAPLAVRPS